MPSKETTDKRYALSLVRRWARGYDEAYECRDEAIRRACEYATVAEVAEAAGLRRQSIYKILNKSVPSVDSEKKRA